MDALAIGGTPSEGRERIREYRARGVDIPIIYPPRAPSGLIRETITELAPR
jgi:alkanesulfonate monooxygenase SsuD/methylene tetrahydromethanopterin reductase-like flavin-dependent oxidoreductase (luciferase family)